MNIHRKIGLQIKTNLNFHNFKKARLDLGHCIKRGGGGGHAIFFLPRNRFFLENIRRDETPCSIIANGSHKSPFFFVEEFEMIRIPFVVTALWLLHRKSLVSELLLQK